MASVVETRSACSLSHVLGEVVVSDCCRRAAQWEMFGRCCQLEPITRWASGFLVSNNTAFVDADVLAAGQGQLWLGRGIKASPSPFGKRWKLGTRLLEQRVDRIELAERLFVNNLPGGDLSEGRKGMN